MLPILLQAHFGDEIKTVEISKPYGTGSDSYHITIDSVHQGRVWKTKNYGWQHDINPKSELVTADITIIIELIEKQNEH